MERTHLHASFLNQTTGKVRHFLIDEVTGPAFTDLILYTAEAEEQLTSGTLHDSRQKADQLGQAWVKEGFTWVKKYQPLYELFEHAVKLAMRLGHDAIFDPTLKQTDPRKPNCNFTGHVQLKDWRGIQAKNGGTYKYAVTLQAIIAAPQPPPDSPELTSIIKMNEALESAGPTITCLFEDPTFVG